MKKITSAPLLLTLALVAAPAAQAESTVADNAMDQSLQAYNGLQLRGQWLNPWMPSGTGVATIAPDASADQRLMDILAGYKRDMLDRGGWVNQTLANAHYASGNPLLAARVGDGVTLRVAASVLTPRPALLALKP